MLEKSYKELVSLPIACSGLSDTTIAGTWTGLNRIDRPLIILHYCISYMSKGLFTRREEDPDTRKILEGETTFRLGLHVEISVHVVNSREGI